MSNPTTEADQSKRSASEAQSPAGDGLGALPVRHVPRLTIKTTPGVPPKYEVEGWNEVNLWANRNCAIWRAITDRTAFAGMSEVDILKMIAAELMRQNEEMQRQLWNAAMKHGPSIFLPNTEMRDRDENAHRNTNNL